MKIRAALLLAACALLSAAVFFLTRQPALPFHANAQSLSRGLWKAYGGTWEVAGASLRNESSERGAKLIAGSKKWTDYSMDADLQLLGPGDAGVLVRVSDAETGVDSYTGYYIGLRTLNDTFFIGRAQHGWQEYPANQMPGGVRPFEWYHLHVAVAGCRLEAQATSRSTGQSSSVSLTADECYPAGQVGLRSYSAGGIWRNVSVAALRDGPAQQTVEARAALPVADALALARNVRGSYLRSVGARLDASVPAMGGAAQPVSSLRLHTTEGKPVTVRGVVVLSTPKLYIQDGTGGVAVEKIHGPPLKVGDEVEVRGDVTASGFHSELRRAEVRLLWEGEPPSPYSVTLNQAASGAYDSTFVEVEALLKEKGKGPGDTLRLTMEGRNQEFQAILNPGRSSALSGTLGPGSTLRLRGICSADPAYTRNVDPFALLVRSVEDVQVVAGPPWWSWHFLLRVLVAALVLALVAYVLYLRARNWRMGAVLEERGRMAHEIHDTLAQSFAGIGFQLQAIRKRLPSGDAALSEQVELACALVRHSHEETRRSIAVLRHEPATPMTLSENLRDCARRMVGNDTQRMAGNGGLSLDVQTKGQPCVLPLDVESALLRIGQEAMANAVSHSGASEVLVRVDYRRDGVALSVEDNGCGFNTSVASNGFGLSGIRHRAAGIGAAIRIESVPGRGTWVETVARAPRGRQWTDWLAVRRRPAAVLTARERPAG